MFMKNWTTVPQANGSAENEYHNTLKKKHILQLPLDTKCNERQGNKFNTKPPNHLGGEVPWLLSKRNNWLNLKIVVIWVFLDD